MSTAIVADLVKALEIARDFIVSAPLESPSGSTLKEQRIIAVQANEALANAKRLDLDGAIYVKEQHFESYCHGPYLRIPLRPTPSDTNG